MSDHIPGNDPLDERLRATFSAEHEIVKARHQAGPHGVLRRRSRSLVTWIPVAAAAGLLVLAGFFFFFGNGSTDQTFELGVADEADDYVPDNPVGERPAPTATPDDFGPPPTPPALPTPALPPPGPAPDSTPNVVGAPIPVPFPPASTNECGIGIAPFAPQFVWDIAVNDPDGGLVAHTDVGIDAPVTRVLTLDEVVVATGGCRLSAGGSPWFELVNASGAHDWVSSRYLREPGSACLTGEQYGSRVRDGDGSNFYTIKKGDILSDIVARFDIDIATATALNPGLDLNVQFEGQRLRVSLGGSMQPFFYTVEPGDVVGSIATKFNVTRDAILDLNPDVDTALLRVDSQLLIPTAANVQEQFLGPLDGYRIVDDGWVAFAVAGTPTYRWFEDSGDIGTGACFGGGETGPVCLIGRFVLEDLQQPEPLFAGDGTTIALRTGREIESLQPGNADLIEVQLGDGPGSGLVGLINPELTNLLDGPCPSVNAPTPDDGFDVFPCAIDSTTNETASGTAGSPDSDADHIHNLRASSDSQGCSRVVIELGTNIYEDNDSAAQLVPEISVVKTAASTVIRFNTCEPRENCPQFNHGSQEPGQAEFPGGVAFVAIDRDFEPHVRVLHHPGLSSVTLLDNPARIVVDIQPSRDVPGGQGPLVGEYAILDRFMTPNILSPFFASGRQIPTVTGYASPFEAAGLWHVFTAKPDGTVGELPASIASGRMPTVGWAGGMGAFSVDLPMLPPGDYIAAFGEAPPVDGVTFIGSGQWFRVLEPGVNPNAQTDVPDIGSILQDVYITNPILVLD